MQDGSEFLEILQAFSKHKADVILVGGLAAILQGSPIMTEDVDLVYLPSPDNISKLLTVLDELEARYRDPIGRHIVPNAERLEKQRINLLLTKHGKVDLLQVIGNDLDYSKVVNRSSSYELQGSEIQVLDLDLIIQSKEEADRPKDRYSLLFLRELVKMKEGP